MDLQFLKNYFSQDYPGIESIIKQVYQPIFGKENYEDGFDVLTRGDTAFARKAKEHKIVSIFYYGKIYTEDIELNIYDVTLDSSAHIATSRVGIRQIVAEMVEAFDGALVVFHYAGNASNRSWRLSYIEKIKGMQRKAKRFTYLCGQNYSCRTIAERFIELQHSPKNAKALEAAFSVEALSDEFFTDYKKRYETFCKYIEDNKNDASRFGYEFSHEESKYIRDYVKKMLGRLTFLCFLQRRGWLGVPVTEKDWHGGDTQFLFNLYRKATDEQKENFLDEILEPLFFDCLNEKREGDIFDTKVPAIGKVKIPYLNGGLFDKDEIDKPRSVFPAKLFGDLFEFFASYNFTIDENDPNDAEVGVDPEMLGKIFENLLEDNKDNGTFYTPKEIVHYMCRESLIAYLIDEAKSKSTTTENFEDAIRTFVSDPEISVKRITQYYDKSQLSDLSQSLKSVKICDPAIGSGAFPMGLLNLIYRCRLFLNQALGIKQTAAQLKQEIIQNNIYGVDIEKGAIDIARLRFWLSIIVDAESPEPLPNFDYKFMQGNSLLEQFEGVDLKELLPKEDENDGLRLVFSEEQAQYEILKNRQEQYFRENDHKRKYELREHINTAVKDLIRTRTTGRQDIATALENINVSANTQFFLWHTWFADVFNRPSKQGFDIVIGNPPYGANIDALVKVYAKVYPDTSHGFKDIYKYFFDQGLRILRSGGTLSYITPSTFIRQPRYGDVRRLMLKYYIVKLVDLGENVFNAVVPVAISLLQKNIGCNVLMSDLTKETNIQNAIGQIKYIKVSQSVFNDTINNIFVEPIKLGAKTKLLTDVLEMKDCGFKYQRSNVGLSQKGKNDLADRIFYVGELENNEDKPILIGKDINAYYHLESPSKKLRHNYNDLLRENEGTYYNKEIMAAPIKLIWRQTAPFFIGTILSEPIFFGNTIQAGVIKEEYKDSISYEYLCGLLNSSYLRHLYTHNVKETGRVFPQVKLEKLRPLPIILAEKEEQDRIKKIVEVIIAAKRNNPQADTSVEEKEIDKLVYQLYELSEDEIKLIEKE